MAKRKLPDEPEHEEVYVLKTTDAEETKTITKSVSLEIPDFMERMSEEEENVIKSIKFKVGEKDFSIMFYRLSDRFFRVCVYSQNNDKINATVTIKVPGIEINETLNLEWSYMENIATSPLISLDKYRKLAEENEGVIKVDVQITLRVQEPERKSVWKG